MASFSLAMLPVDEMLAALGVLRVTEVGLHKAHCRWRGSTPEACSAIAAKCRAAGVTITGTGVVSFSNHEARARAVFENIKAAGVPTIACRPERDSLPLLERLAREYDVRLAIHNHGPTDTLYPSPLETWDLIQPFDRRIGLCLDVGHAERAGVDSAAAIRRCAPRLYDVHLRDSIAVEGTAKEVAVEIGAGRLDIPGILDALIEVEYSHVVALEIRKPKSNPLLPLAESIGYLRGALAA